ncbi:hypothetical protein SKAU_G00061810 [Synaphobranchus kaupii]|uniref:Uncharacterized protein n=1 Tax=Synaphobranchus kaupii TaxID=118154 RepID=A0A9Q1J9N8_SYNKA|nr:hypothetical protein SKAU_G00061810 [Synaphobranchus kaupii]
MIRSASLIQDEGKQLQVKICDHHKLFERRWKAEVANPANIHCGYHTEEQMDVLGHPVIGDCNRFERYHHRVKDIDLRHHVNKVLPDVSRLQVSKKIMQPELIEKMESRILLQEHIFLGAKI